MYRVRQWSVTHARRLEVVYRGFEPLLFRLHPLFKWLGYGRLEKPVRIVEKAVKGFMFDCQMCGKCALSATGMSCPMNCPKSIRNGPCGGVRLDGNCEIKPEMRCVWVEAWRGSRQMRDPDAIQQVQIPVNHLIKNSSSWLRVVRLEYAVHDEETGK
ncbi:MAG: methylenetetrahydrofolate reductase C-terminal domain-containing protein [Gammaproteobacteria bacterium]|nr:methylenetetrahydrofolate reductase C-terminal domain-containing protein [Gammaproteobacteria bacterium]MDH3447085.1 methylenetetrahydrofolate reductase C-terminal domain-containing protein [Gammaproteobacteria bacterium]